MAFRTSGDGGGGGPQKNVLGGPLALCSDNPVTGFFRTGCCHTGPQDAGVHTVCAIMTDAFLGFSKSRGNDLSTPRPDFGFHGLKAGDRWCLCAARWKEAYDAGKSPKLVLAATHERTLTLVSLDALKTHAIDVN